jgi:hypothetical protein
MSNDDTDPLDPSGIAQFIQHDRCRRYLKQRVDPGDEPEAREWTEAFSAMNAGLLGEGQEFEAIQIEALAANAARIIGPELEATGKAGVPEIDIDETWAESTAGRRRQLQEAAEAARQLSTDGEPSYILCYQAPLGGQLGAESVWGEADCLVFAPAQAEEIDVVARVLEIKSATEQQRAHRVQVAIYSALLDEILGETDGYRIETSVLTRPDAAAAGESLDPFAVPTFSREKWVVFAEGLLAADGPVESALTDDLEDLPFALDQVCNNCAYREACATRAVEDPTAASSLALLGVDASVQRALKECDITNLRELSELMPRVSDPQPTDPPPELDLAPARQRKLEQALPGPVHRIVQRAQVLRGEIDPTYSAMTRPPAYRGQQWVPLPDDRVSGWGNIETASPGELIHVAVFVRPDSTIDRVGALGACVYAAEDGTYHTVSETLDAVPKTAAAADELEAALFDRFCRQVFDAIETVTEALGSSSAALHWYTYTKHELDALAEGLERHPELDNAQALRNLLNLHRDGHTETDQEMATAVQPIVNEYFALAYSSQGLLAVAEQFIPGWTIEAFDPLDARGETPPLRSIFGYQFVREQVPYLEAPDRIRLHLARRPLAEGPAAAAVGDDETRTTPDGWYPIRKRAGGQFPIEYLWAALPATPGAETPRLTPDRVTEWTADADTQALYRQEIEGFYYRTKNKDDPIQRSDIEYLCERLSYTLCRLVESIPYKDTYFEKQPLETGTLSEFEVSATDLPSAARDYLQMEHGARREATLEHYRQPLRDRARSGRSILIECTGVETNADGSLSITGTLAYESVFEATAADQIARQARIRGDDDSGGGSWRVLTRLNPTTDDTPGAASSTYVEAGIGSPKEIQHSPPVRIDSLDQATGSIQLTAFPHRFKRNYTLFRVDHCGWRSPDGHNLDDPTAAPADRDGVIAARPPVGIEPGARFVLDPMVDEFGAPKANRALQPSTIKENVLYQHLKLIEQTGQQPPTMAAPPAGVERFCERLREAPACLTPNERQQAFINATDRAIVPLQGPPGTGKTRGAIAPAVLGRAFAHAEQSTPFVGFVVAPSHEAVDAALEGVVATLAEWRHTETGLSTLELLRVQPSSPPDETARVDADTAAVEVTYCNYHDSEDAATLSQITEETTGEATGSDASPGQYLLFMTPATLYQTLGTMAESVTAIDGTSAPAAMRHEQGIADVLCVDEASMLDVPALLLAGSALKPSGQTLLIGDHRQLATITAVDWQETLRRSVTDADAHRSALDYVRRLVETAPQASCADRAGGDTNAD